LFWQITSTTPWRRMILHFSHIGFTDGRTFMIPFGGLGPATWLWLPVRQPLPGRGYAFTRAGGLAQGQDSAW
jgi:hypothetical protein